MAAFFFDAYYQKKKKYKPLVVVGPVDAEGNCNVIGFSGPPTSSSKVRSWLGVDSGMRASPALMRNDAVQSPRHAYLTRTHT